MAANIEEIAGDTRRNAAPGLTTIASSPFPIISGQFEELGIYAASPSRAFPA